jgi:hypothetical protein
LPLRHLDVYGQDHSPWVQAVLLGLHEKRVPHDLTTAPPLSHFLEWGILMPAARAGGEPWQIESGEILERIGFNPIGSGDARDLRGAWGGVVHRVDHAPRFWARFSRVRDPHPALLARLRNHFLRSFAVFYFFSLLTFLSRFSKSPKQVDFVDQFRVWEDRLAQSSGEFIGGEEPNALDMTLFGIIQCHCSVPVPPIRALQEDPGLKRMRRWIGAMQSRLADYPHLYSGVYFEPRRSAPEPASRVERMSFWLGGACMFLAFPLTLPLVIVLARRVRSSLSARAASSDQGGNS